MTQTAVKDSFIEKMESEGYGYLIVRNTNTEKGYVGLRMFIYTVAIVTDLDHSGYRDRYCYHNLMEAIAHLEDWQAQGYKDEPKGWHRSIMLNENKEPIERRG